METSEEIRKRFGIPISLSVWNSAILLSCHAIVRKHVMKKKTKTRTRTMTAKTTKKNVWNVTVNQFRAAKDKEIRFFKPGSSGWIIT